LPTPGVSSNRSQLASSSLAMGKYSGCDQGLVKRSPTLTPSVI
jgi:hypothetical protein